MADPGEGPGGPGPPPPYFYIKLRPEGPKNFFLRPLLPYLKVWIHHCILMQIKLIFIWKVLHLASFWKWEGIRKWPIMHRKRREIWMVYQHCPQDFPWENRRGERALGTRMFSKHLGSSDGKRSYVTKWQRKKMSCILCLGCRRFGNTYFFKEEKWWEKWCCPV